MTVPAQRITFTGFIGVGGAKETTKQFEAYTHFCEVSERNPELRINDILGKVTKNFNQSPRIILNWYKELKWAERYRGWRSKQKELSLRDPEKKVIELVKDLEKVGRAGTTLLYEWIQTLQAKNMVGKEVELVANIVLKATELAMRYHAALPQSDTSGISFKANNVQLVIKE